MTLGDIDDVVRQGRPRRAGQHLRCTVTSRCRWSAAGSSPTGTPPPSTSRSTPSTQSPHMVRMLLPPQIDVPMEQIRVLAERRRRRVRPQERRGPRGRRRRGRVHRPRPPGEVDRGPARASGLRRAGARGDGRHRGGRHRRRRAARRADGRQAQHGRLRRCDPFPGAIYVDVAQRLVPGPDQDRGASPRTTPRSSATRRRTSSYRGPWATGDFLRERMLDVIARELGIDPIDVRRRNYVHRGRAAARRCSPDSRSSASPPSSASSRRRRIVDWDGFRRRQAEALRRRAGTSGSASRRTSRPRPDPRCPASAARATASSATRSRTSRSRTTASSRSSPASSRTARATRRRSRRSRSTSSASGSKTSTCVFGDTDVTPDRAGRHRRQPGGDHGERRRCSTGRGSCASRSLSLAADVLEANPADLEIGDGVDQRARHPERRSSRWRSWRGSSRRSRSRLPDGADNELKVTREYDGGESGWSGGTHCCEVEVDVETGLVSDRPLRRGRGLRCCPSTRPSSRARSAAASRRRSGRCSSSTRPTARTVSSSPRRSWTT